MSNPMKYIKALEAAGFERHQAEAQVQMILEVLEGDLVTKLVTKNDFAVYQERIDNRFIQVQHQITESEFRITTRLGILTVSTVSIAVAILTWLIKVQ